MSPKWTFGEGRSHLSFSELWDSCNTHPTEPQKEAETPINDESYMRAQEETPSVRMPFQNPYSMNTCGSILPMKHLKKTNTAADHHSPLEHHPGHQQKEISSRGHTGNPFCNLGKRQGLEPNFKCHTVLSASLEEEFSSTSVSFLK